MPYKVKALFSILLHLTKTMIGDSIYALAKELWPLNRSITGDGVRQTLARLKQELPGLQIKEVPSGTKVFDWTVPLEWKVKGAWIVTPEGKKIGDFSVNNLHLLGYSTPFEGKMSLEELLPHLYSLPDQPTAIPYITSYYKERWGFCLTDNDKRALKRGMYEVHIDTELFQGSLTYGELIIKGECESEVFLSTYVCHPSMANNELSGPTVATHLAMWLLGLRARKYTYRIVFIPETIGSLTYLSLNLPVMKKRVVAGFNLTCIGDERCYSFLPSRNGKTLSDVVARHVLKHLDPAYKAYRWTDRGSDERQYCAPNVDLPVASIMRSKYGEYPEYHTSLDAFDTLVTPKGLEGGYEALRLSLEAIEKNCFPRVTVCGEPQLGKRGLYPTLSTKASKEEVRLMTDLITWSDGTKSLIEIAELCDAPVWALYPLLDKLVAHELIVCSDEKGEN